MTQKIIQFNHTKESMNKRIVYYQNVNEVIKCVIFFYITDEILVLFIMD